jgi:hypothetical protein
MEAAEICEISEVVVIEARQSVGWEWYLETDTVGANIAIRRRYAQLIDDPALRVIFSVRSVCNGNAMDLAVCCVL